MSDTKQFILLVEDDDAIRLTFRDYLQEKGFAVLVASDGVEAIKKILDHAIRVIVTDYRMPLFGGNYWIRFLEKYCSDKKIIVTSGFLRPEFSMPFPVVYKPFQYESIVEMLKTESDE